MDSARFLLPCNRDHPVRAGARAEGGGGVCLCLDKDRRSVIL